METIKSNKDLYQEMLERQIEEQAKEQGLTVEDLLIMLEEQKAEEQRQEEEDLSNLYFEEIMETLL